MPDLGPDDKRPPWRKEMLHDRPNDLPSWLSVDCTYAHTKKECDDPTCTCVCHMVKP